jgi:hypothetical protein
MSERASLCCCPPSPRSFIDHRRKCLKSGTNISHSVRESHVKSRPQSGLRRTEKDQVILTGCLRLGRASRPAASSALSPRFARICSRSPVTSCTRGSARSKFEHVDLRSSARRAVPHLGAAKGAGPLSRLAPVSVAMGGSYSRRLGGARLDLPPAPVAQSPPRRLDHHVTVSRPARLPHTSHLTPHTSHLTPGISHPTPHHQRQ